MKKTYKYYVKTNMGYWGMGQTLNDAIENANYQKHHKAWYWIGKGVHWSDDQGAIADEWENNGQSIQYSPLSKAKYDRMPECQKGKAKARIRNSEVGF